VEHALKACHRGGARQRLRGLGEQIHLEGFNARGGCPECGVPREFCDGWQKHDRHWSRSDRLCQYETVMYDTVIGLFHCGDDRYHIDLLEDMMDADIPSPNYEEVASWLGRKLVVDGVRGSQFVRTLMVWTRMTWRVQLAG